jgi:hypothetical protein
MSKNKLFYFYSLYFLSIISCGTPTKNDCISYNREVNGAKNNIIISLCGFEPKTFQNYVIRNGLKNGGDWDLELELSEEERIHRFNANGYICLNKNKLIEKFKININDTLSSALYNEKNYIYYFYIPLNVDTIQLQYAPKAVEVPTLRQ